MDGYLTKLSDSLAPSQEFLTHADQVMDRLFRTLQRDSGYRIDRLCPGGGKEKKTSLGYAMDYDVTAFVNNVTPPFNDLLLKFKEVISTNFGVSDVKVKPRSLHFTLEGIDFDLLPATNLAPSHLGAQGHTWDRQRAAMMAQITGSANVRQAAIDNAPALTETAVEFVKRQSAFVHKVARLAKYWNSTIFYNGPQYGRSYRFEVLGIIAGQEEEKANPRKLSILRAFKLFLKKVETINSQRIIVTGFYRESDVQSNILQQRPLIMDPSNPYNNLAFNFKDRNLFSQCARESLQRLERMETSSGLRDFKSIFLPQPKPVEMGPQIEVGAEKILFRMPSKWLVGAETRARQIQPNLTVRKSSLSNYTPVLENIKKFLSAFLFVVDMEALDGGIDRKIFARDRMAETIDSLFDRNRHNMCYQGNHATYDVTFKIPIGRVGGDTLIISGTW